MSTQKGADRSLIAILGKFARDGKGIQILRAVVREGLSKLTEITVEFTCADGEAKPETFLGEVMTLRLMAVSGPDRKFSGTVVSIEKLGLRRGLHHFAAELRPTFWMLAQNRDSRVFQNKTTVDIIKHVLADAVTEVRFAVSQSYQNRNYCVQYRESDFTFLSRLMEEEGIYYYFEYDRADADIGETLVICDGTSGSHEPISAEPRLPFLARDRSELRRDDHIAEWSAIENVTPGEVTLRDHDHEMQTWSDLTVRKRLMRGRHRYNRAEIYDFPAHYRGLTTTGEYLARVKMEAEAARFALRRGAGTVRNLATGRTFEIYEREDPEASFDPGEFLIIAAEHRLQESGGFEEVEIRRDLDPDRVAIPKRITDVYSCVFTAMPAEEPFRAPQSTPWPVIPGIQTGTVVGPRGEEINVDSTGRVKVQFHWDREGKRNEEASCWIRVVTGWAGNDWGFAAAPRVGMEVAVMFEEGNPDRPIVTGMLYNQSNPAPWSNADRPTQIGLRTNSSKGGNGFHELMFDDLKESELVRFQSERDFVQIVKNDAKITIGQDKKDPGSLSQTVYKDFTEKIETGNHVFDIERGDQKLDIKIGNQTVKVGGKIIIEARQSITFRVGDSSVKIDPTGVTIKGTMVKIEGAAMVEAKAPLSTVKGDTTLILKGSVTMIN